MNDLTSQEKDLIRRHEVVVSVLKLISDRLDKIILSAAKIGEELVDYMMIGSGEAVDPDYDRTFCQELSKKMGVIETELLEMVR